MSFQTLIAISREPIAQKLIFELKEKALVFVTNLHTEDSPIFNGSYHSERWSCNQQLDLQQRESLRSIASQFNTDLCFLKPEYSSHSIRILAMDMDSTFINIECIDEIADFAGKKAAVAQITEATMRGEIKDFK